MTKIKLSALACAILVGGQQLVAEDVNDIIDLGDYLETGVYNQSVDINNKTKIITGNPFDVRINVDNNGELISRVPFFYGQTDINIQNNSKATFENEVTIETSNFHIND